MNQTIEKAGELLSKTYHGVDLLRTSGHVPSQGFEALSKSTQWPHLLGASEHFGKFWRKRGDKAGDKAGEKLANGKEAGEKLAKKLAKMCSPELIHADKAGETKNTKS